MSIFLTHVTSGYGFLWQKAITQPLYLNTNKDRSFLVSRKDWFFQRNANQKNIIIIIFLKIYELAELVLCSDALRETYP